MDTASTTKRRAELIGRAMRDAGFTPFTLAEATGIPRTTLGRRLLGTSPFNTEELDAIAAQLGKRVSELLLEEAK